MPSSMYAPRVLVQLTKSKGRKTQAEDLGIAEPSITTCDRIIYPDFGADLRVRN